MKRPMTKYKVEVKKQEEHSFVKTNTGQLAYAHFGKLKTFANKTQADKTIEKLTYLGFTVSRTISYPFLVVQL